MLWFWGAVQIIVITTIFFLSKAYITTPRNNLEKIYQGCPFASVRYSVWAVPYVIFFTMTPMVFLKFASCTLVVTFFGIIIGLGQGPFTTFFRWCQNTTIGNTKEILICEVCKGWVILVMILLLTEVSDDLDEEIRRVHGIEEELHELTFSPDEIGYWLLLVSIIALSWVSVVRFSVFYYCGFDSKKFYETYLGVKCPQDNRSLREQYYCNPSAIWRIGHLGSQDYGFIDPNDYRIATYEILVLMVLVGWGLTISFRPDIVNSNPLKDRMGYNHMCVGFDATPANEICAVMWIFSVYYLIRWLNYDMQASMNKSCYDDTDSWHISVTKSFSKISRGFLVLTACGFMLCFIIRPEDNVWGHTLPFCVYVIGRLFHFWAKFVEMLVDGKETTAGSILFALVYSMLSLGYCLIMGYTVFLYQRENLTGFDPPLHLGWWWPFDWGWIVIQSYECLVLPKIPIVSTKLLDIEDCEGAPLLSEQRIVSSDEGSSK